MVHSWLKSHFVPQGWWLRSAVLVRTPAWGKGVQSEDALYGGLSRSTNLGKAYNCQVKVDVHPSMSHTSGKNRRFYPLLQMLLLYQANRHLKSVRNAFASWRKGHQKLLMLKNVASFSKTSEPFGWNLCKKIQPQAGIWCGKFQPKLLFWQSCKQWKCVLRVESVE